LCASIAAAFGANAANQYSPAGVTTTTIEITKPVTITATNSYKVEGGQASGGAGIKTADGSIVDMYIGVSASSPSVQDLHIVDDTQTLTLIAQPVCGNSVTPELDQAAGRSGVNTGAVTCKNVSSMLTMASGMEPSNPAPGTYTFKQEYGTFTE
ncbi:TPA: hypothetical protein OF772_005402, partial [Escherichia coli]|nr:hypothetical protein [Escherichia coli]